MNEKEIKHILSAIIIFTIIFAFKDLVMGDYSKFGFYFFFSAIIIFTNIIFKKIAAKQMHIDVEHEIWKWRRYGLNRTQTFENPVSIGVIFPILISILSLGIVKVPLLLTFESCALSSKAFKKTKGIRYAGITDIENGIIASWGTIAVIVLSILAYIFGLEQLFKMGIYYSFFNLLPFSRLDGVQLLAGAKLRWTILFIITCLMTAFAMII